MEKFELKIKTDKLSFVKFGSDLLERDTGAPDDKNLGSRLTICLLSEGSRPSLCLARSTRNSGSRIAPRLARYRSSNRGICAAAQRVKARDAELAPRADRISDVTKPIDQCSSSGNDDYAWALQWLWSALSRSTGDGVIYDLEIMLGVFCDRTKRSVITGDQRDDLLPLLLEASYHAMDLMPETYSRDQIETAFDAAQSILQVWSTPIDERHNRSPGLIWECYCIVGMFKADLKNLRLAKEISDRRQRAGDARPFHFHSHGVIPAGGAKIIPFPRPKGSGRAR